MCVCVCVRERERERERESTMVAKDDISHFAVSTVGTPCVLMTVKRPSLGV